MGGMLGVDGKSITVQSGYLVPRSTYGCVGFKFYNKRVK